MMKIVAGDQLINNMLYSCVTEKQRGHEQFVEHHSLGFILSGEIHFETVMGTIIGEQGSIGLAKSN